MTMRTTVPSPQPEQEPRATDEAEGVLAEHQVRQDLLVAILDRRGGQGLVEGDVAAVAVERALAAGLGIALLDHRQGVVVERRADFHALGAALAVVRVDEEAEVGAFEALLGGHVAVLGRVDEVRTWPSRRRGPGSAGWRRKPSIALASEPLGWAVAMMALSGQALTQAMQPTHFSASNCRDQRREGAEVADAGGGRSDEAAPHVLSAGSSTSATPRR